MKTDGRNKHRQHSPRPIAHPLASAINWTLVILGVVAWVCAQKYEPVDIYCLVKYVLPVVAISYAVLLGMTMILFKREGVIKKLPIPAAIMFASTWLLCSQALQIYNGFADTGAQKKVVYTVLEKQHLYNNAVAEGRTLITDAPCPLNVERRVYQNAHAGDKFLLVTKKGRLGVEWIVSLPSA